MAKLRNYLQSTSTWTGYGVGLLMLLSYGKSFESWDNSQLWALCIFIGFFIPFYSRFSNRIEERIQLKTACVTPGRLGRFAAQLLFNLFVFEGLFRADVIPSAQFAPMGGLLFTAILTTASSQGIQYVALSLANREIGDRNRNVMAGLSLNIVMTALAALGLDWARTIFYFAGFGLGGLLFILSFLSDLRGIFAPQGGVGVFFGTFNPFHRTHLEIIKKTINDRGLTHVYLHCTVIPKLHRDALARGQIRIQGHENGMRVYAKTERADIQVNYFPTGNQFFEYETRVLLMRLAIEQAGLSQVVTVVSLPEVYADTGFYGVLAHIKRHHPRQAIHGLHGSDLGGMWVRTIYDESGWIYPYPVRRIDGVSATAIRQGTLGMASPVVEDVLAQIRAGSKKIQVGTFQLKFSNGVIEYA